MTFKTVQNLKYGVCKLVELGFYYDEKRKEIVCSGCSKAILNLEVERIYDLVQEHLNQPNQKKCSLRDSHLSFIDSISIKNDAKNNKKTEQMKIYESEKERFKSFEGIEIALDVKLLSENGFYLINGENRIVKEIKCNFCEYGCFLFKQSLLNNNYENPIKEHAHKYPNCPMNKDKTEITCLKNVGNIISNLENTSEIGTKPLQYNINGNLNFGSLKHILEKSTNVTFSKPYHPEYATEQSRLDSFINWPSNLTQKPPDLAKAGFFSFGKNDMVKCFYCDGGIRNWDQFEDPIVEHTRWYPRCPYIKLYKGEDFIEKVRQMYKDMDSGFIFDYEDTLSCSNKKKRSISPRTLNARLDLSLTRKVIKLGIDRSLVKKAIENKLIEEENDFENPVDLLKACFKLKEKILNYQQLKEKFHFYISNVKIDLTQSQVSDVFEQHFGIRPKSIQ